MKEQLDYVDSQAQCFSILITFLWNGKILHDNTSGTKFIDNSAAFFLTLVEEF